MLHISFWRAGWRSHLSFLIGDTWKEHSFLGRMLNYLPLSLLVFHALTHQSSKDTEMNRYGFPVTFWDNMPLCLIFLCIVEFAMFAI